MLDALNPELIKLQVTKPEQSGPKGLFVPVVLLPSADTVFSLPHSESQPLADFPCWNCNQEYISIDDELYPYGHCINCGEENEILTCVRCGGIYSLLTDCHSSIK